MTREREAAIGSGLRGNQRGTDRLKGYNHVGGGVLVIRANDKKFQFKKNGLSAASPTAACRRVFHSETL